MSQCATLDVLLMTFLYSFFPDAHRITSKEYIPSNSDILRAPVLFHSGAMGTCFPMGQLIIRLYNVTLWRISGERKKWIHLFENITSIIFCASLLDYDRRGEHGEERDTFLSS